MFLRSRLFWGSVSLCICIGVLFGFLLYKANQPQEPIIIYKTVIPEKRAVLQTSDKPTVQTSDVVNKTETVFMPMDSEVFIDIDSGDFSSATPQFFDTDAQIEESTLFVDAEDLSTSEPEEERFFGLTLAEIEERIPVLKAEIQTNLTTAIDLYTGLSSTDELARKSPEIAAMRRETWAEVRRLFYEASRQKIPRYVSYLLVTNGDNPLRPGGWLSELMKPLPMGVSYNGTFH